MSMSWKRISETKLLYGISRAGMLLRGLLLLPLGE